MSAKDDIIKALQQHQPPQVNLPDLEGGWIQYENVKDQFCQVLDAVGGTAIPVTDIGQLNKEISLLTAQLEAKKVYSEIPEISAVNVNPDTLQSPYDCESIDFALIRGDLGIAENGAIWVTDQSIKHRVTWFITQHLGIILSPDCILHNLHEAYRQITFTEPQFGLFISGPSKTADIEQSLVIGAHGPRSLTVFLLEKSS